MKAAVWIYFISCLIVGFYLGHTMGERDYYKQQTKEWGEMCIDAVDLAEGFKNQRDSLCIVIDSIK